MVWYGMVWYGMVWYGKTEQLHPSYLGGLAEPARYQGNAPMGYAAIIRGFAGLLLRNYVGLFP